MVAEIGTKVNEFISRIILDFGEIGAIIIYREGGRQPPGNEEDGK